MEQDILYLDDSFEMIEINSDNSDDLKFMHESGANHIEILGAENNKLLFVFIIEKKQLIYLRFEVLNYAICYQT